MRMELAWLEPQYVRILGSGITDFAPRLIAATLTGDQCHMHPLWVIR